MISSAMLEPAELRKYIEYLMRFLRLLKLNKTYTHLHQNIYL